MSKFPHNAQYFFDSARVVRVLANVRILLGIYPWKKVEKRCWLALEKDIHWIFLKVS